MNGKKQIYKGRNFEFTKGEQIGQGGNGKVFNTNILNSENNEDCVVKVLSLKKWNGNKALKEKRYRRFYREISTVQKVQNEISGIMKIMDFYCPEEMEGKKEVWYLMKKAKSYRAASNENKFNITTKIKNIFDLSNILFSLHNKGYAHRDIKIDNLLFIEDILMLSDFGLIWNNDVPRITEDGENIGPRDIRPPELENIDIDNISLDIDFRASDVYLFGKVVWMIIKNDMYGFKGEYKRDPQLYLNAKDYEIKTFEPIHTLLENSTKFYMNERIDMKECKRLITEQLSIINDGSSKEAFEYKFNEIEKKIINNIKPNGRIYRDFDAIYNIINELITNSKIIIEEENDLIKANLISKWIDDQSIIFENNQIKGFYNSYICYPNYIEHTNRGFELHVKRIERKDIHANFVSYKDRISSYWGISSYNIFLDEPLVILFKI